MLSLSQAWFPLLLSAEEREKESFRRRSVCAYHLGVAAFFCTRLSGGWPMRERKESGRTIEFFFLRFARSGLASLILRISFDDTAARKKEERTPVLVGECGHSRSLDPTLLPPQQTPSLFPFVVSAPHSRRQGSRSREIGTLQSFDVRRRVLKQKHTHAWPPPWPRRGTPPGSASSRRATTAVAPTLWRTRQQAT